MTRLRILLSRLREFVHGRSVDWDFREELTAHLEEATDEYVRQGMSPAEARRAALRSLGGIEQAREAHRDVRSFRWIEDVVRDVRFAVRSLGRSPAFTISTIATLTLAIGANTATFSLVDPLLFRDLPVRNPGSLVQVTWQYPGDPPLNQFAFEDFQRYRDNTTVFSDMVGLVPLVTTSPTGHESASAEVVTGNFFHALGVRPALGRLLDGNDDTPGAVATAVVSSRYWQTQFNGEARVLGAFVNITDSRLPQPLQATVVGVAEPGFSGVAVGRPPDVWLSANAIPTAMRARAGWALMARLKPGTSIDEARAEMRVFYQPTIDLLAQRDPQWRHVAVEVTSARAGLSTPVTDQFGGPLSMLMAVVVVLLLLACANIGGLLLARGVSRQREIALRLALGAGRVRVVRQLLTESLLLAAAGGVVGLVGARFGATVLMGIVSAGTRSPNAPPPLAIPLDARVLLFTVGVTVVATIIFGFAPAIAAYVSAPARPLRQVGGTQPRSPRILGNGLVVAQIAISLALLSVSQLYITHLGDLRHRNLGFDRDDVLLMAVNTPGTQGPEQMAALYAEVAVRLRALPGVESVASSGMTPMSGAAGSSFLRVEEFEEPSEDRSRVSLNPVSPNYFTTYGTPLLAGRDFVDTDRAQPRRVIVNQTLARQYFPDRDPVGRHVWLEGEHAPYEVVGVAGDAKYQDVRLAAPPTLYLFAPLSSGFSEISLRTSVHPTAVAADARRVLADVFGPESVGRVTTLAEQVDASIVPERLLAILAGFFGTVGALLAAIGLFGILAYTVARRTKEIGIRMALGAPRVRVIGMVALSGAWLVGAGFLLGAPAALWSTPLATRAVENPPASGPAPIVAAAAALVVTALIAIYVPTRRATRVEPVVALREE
jgi:putative ABC transport system permease protein